VRRWQLQERGGNTRLTLAGLDQNGLLARRIVAYYAGTAPTSKTGPADDLLKEVVRENYGALTTDPERDWTAAGFSVQGDQGRGPTVDKAFAWRPAADVLDDLVEAAASNGSAVYYAVVPTGPGLLQFRTWLQQPGRDRTAGGPDPLLVGPALGNMDTATLEMDYSAAANFVYAGGQDQGVDRDIVEVWDPNAVASGPFARQERFADARQSATLLQVEDLGRTVLLQSEARQRFVGDLLDVANCRFGVDWRLGDRVSASFAGQQFDCLIRTVDIRVDARGEQITARLEREVVRPRAVQTAIWSGGS